jgi:predicted Zn-dependent protease
MTRFLTRIQNAAFKTTTAAMTAVLVACATNPVTGKRELSFVSESDEIAMGQEGAKQTIAAIGLVPDSTLQRYVSNLGLTMARASERPNLPWQVNVIDDPTVNAFALPGGPVFITRGILAHMNSEAQLVSVLGHEIGHITAKHSVAQMSQQQLGQIGLIAAIIVQPGLAQFGELASQGLGVLFLKFGRGAESQADELGFKYMVQQGYDPHEMGEMFKTLGRLSAGGDGGGRVPEWLSTHPDPGNRVQATQQRIAATTLPAGLTVERDRFLQRTEGLIFGENPRQGFFRQNVFFHPDLKFQLDFPTGWKTQNTMQAVIGVSAQQDAMMALELAENTSPSQGLTEFFKQQGVQNQGSSSNAINGMPAASAEFTAQTQQGQLSGVVSYIQMAPNTYRLMAYTPSQSYNSYRNAFLQAIRSFRPLTDPTMLAVQPVHVQLVRLPRAMTITEFHQAYPSRIPLEQVALINGVDATTAIPAGTLVKRVQ